MALLSTHYRRPLDWNAARLEAARKTLARIYTTLRKVADVAPTPGIGADADVLAALRNDLNVSVALTRLQQLVRTLDSAETHAQQAEAKARLLASAGLLGLLQNADVGQDVGESGAERTDEIAQAERLLAAREQARQRRDFAKADALRNELAVLGFDIQDGASGSRLKPRTEALI